MLKWFLRSAVAAGCVAVTALAWAAYHAGDAAAGWAALWSLCASVR